MTLKVGRKGRKTVTHFSTIFFYFQVFDIVLSEIEPYVGAEQDFCQMFFHLRYPGDDADVSIILFLLSELKKEFIV